MVKMKKQFIMPFCCGLLIWGVLLWIKCIYGYNMIESDSASDIIYAKLMADKNRLILDTWFYSTQIRIFDSELLYALLFKIFPYSSYYTVECIGGAIVYLFVGLLGVVLGKMLKLGANYCWMFLACILPIGHSRFYYVILHGQGFYGFSVIELYSIFCCIFVILKSEKKYLKGFCTIIYIWVAFISGLQGIRLVQNIWLPLIISTSILVYWKKNRQLGFVVLLGTLAAMGGMLVNKYVLANRYVFSSQSDIKFKKFDITGAKEWLLEILSNNGYFEGKSLLAKMSVITAVILMIITVIATIYILVFLNKKVNYSVLLISLYFLFALFIQLTTYCFVVVGMKPRYMFPFYYMLPFILYGSMEVLNKKWLRKVGLCIVIVCALYGSFFNISLDVTTRFNSGGINTISLQKAVQELIEDGYEVGFSSFPYGNSTVEYSNGIIKMNILQDVSSWNQYKWLTTDDFMFEGEEKTFIILSSDEYYNNYEIYSVGYDRLIYSDESIMVLGFGSINALRNTIER